MKKESNKNFNLLLTASTFSNLADGIAGFAYPWLFSLLTRDPLLISIVSVLVNLPRLIFVLYAGVIADKFNRQKILIFTRLGQVFLTSISEYFKSEPKAKALLPGMVHGVVVKITIFDPSKSLSPALVIRNFT